MKITFALATWVYSFLLAVPPLFGISRYTIEGYGIFCCFDYITRNKISRSYMFYLFWGGFIIPLIAIAFSYTKIFFHVRCSHNFSTRHQNGLIESSSRIPIGNDTACSHGKKSVPNPIQEASLKEQMSQSSSSNASSQTSRAAFIKRAPKINVPSSKHEVQLAKVIGLATLAFVVSSIPYSVMSLITQFGPKERVPPTAILIGNIFAKLSIVYNPFIYWCNDPKFRRKLKKAFFSSARLESGQN